MYNPPCAPGTACPQPPGCNPAAVCPATRSTSCPGGTHCTAQPLWWMINRILGNSFQFAIYSIPEGRKFNINLKSRSCFNVIKRKNKLYTVNKFGNRDLSGAS